jgi:hypothetical protein
VPRTRSSSARRYAGASVGEPAADIHGVIARMKAIEASLPRTDGVGYFNRLYLAVTRAVHEDVDGRPTFEDPDFLARLDVVFANFYFAAYDEWAGGRPCPDAWRPLFTVREHPWRRPVQFALAGMNAHINHDLPLAVVATCQERGVEPAKGTPEYRDFRRVNELLSDVEGRVRRWFESGLIADLDRLTGDEADVLAMWCIGDARELAWDQAETLWKLRAHPGIAGSYEDALSRLVELGGRGILL